MGEREAEKRIVHVYGYGHAGSRHAKILRDELGCDVCVFDLNENALKRANLDGFKALATSHGLDYDSCSGVVIAVPPEKQITAVGLALDRYTCRIFCEKPLYSSTLGVALTGLCEIAKDPHRVTVGFQLRANETLKEFIDAHSRSWHFVIRDWQDMATWPKASYSRDILTEFSHEIDLAAWMMQDFQHVIARFERRGKLIVSIMASNGQTCRISIDACYPGYVRDVAAYGGTTWTFTHDANRIAYTEQLRAWLADEPYCTLAHVAKTKKLHDKIMASLQELKWMGA